MMRRFLALTAVAPLWIGLAQENGKLQIHFMNVGQGDGAVLVSPKGQIVLFDNGVLHHCDRPVSYLQQLGVPRIDYHVASHYHSDHIGCTQQVLQEFPLKIAAFDRGGGYTSDTYGFYVSAVGSKRRTANPGETLTLDDGSPAAVRVDFVVTNGDGRPTRNENDRSLVAVVRFGSFDAVIAGDLSGEDTSRYRDIETHVASKVGQVEVYKVNHHGSSHSSNAAWLSVIRPRVAIVSAGDGNPHGHPALDCLDRLHEHGVKTYWTEQGAGAAPQSGTDFVGGNIIVEAATAASTFDVRFRDTLVHTYPMWGATGAPTGTPQFSWSKRARVYHVTSCRYVANISASNLQTGDQPPQGKNLHQGCPR